MSSKNHKGTSGTGGNYGSGNGGGVGAGSGVQGSGQGVGIGSGQSGGVGSGIGGGVNTGTGTGSGSGTGTGTGPQGLTINGQYIKDLSFENPNPGNLFNQGGKAPNYDVNVEIQSQQVGEHSYEVGLKFNIQAKQDKNVYYILELTYAGVFTLPNLPENLLKQFLLIQCPHLLFPYARQVISKTTGEGGFTPLQLNPMDFASLYKNNEGNIQTKSQASGAK